MDYEQSLAILDQLERAYPEAFAAESPTHGSQVVPGPGDEARLEVLVAPGAESEVERWAERLPGGIFDFLYDRARRQIKAVVVEQARYRALIARKRVITGAAAAPVTPGEPIVGYVADTWGTNGLNFKLDGVVSCISCWHVMCAWDGETPVGTPVELRGLPDVATLASYRRVRCDDGREHTWDLAIAKYVDPQMASNVMPPCASGNAYSYPGAFAKQPAPGRVYKVGAASPLCNEADFAGTIFSGGVDYPLCQPRFRGQLVLPLMTDHGDSGALAVYRDSNEILGLHFAIQDNSSLANPLFAIGWSYQGMQGGLPVYTSGARRPRRKKR